MWYGIGEGEELLGAVPVRRVGSGVGESTEVFWAWAGCCVERGFLEGGELGCPWGNWCAWVYLSWGRSAADTDCFARRVVSGSRDATLRLWDIETGQCLHVLMGHVAAVRCVQYDGHKVVSGAYDYTVKVWDPESESCTHTLQGHTNRVYSLQVRAWPLPLTCLLQGHKPVCSDHLRAAWARTLSLRSV